MRSAFTLIELLVVVTIIVVLLALLVPAMDKAIQQAEKAVCASNLYTFGRSFSLYAADNNRNIPRTTHWDTNMYAQWLHIPKQPAELDLDDLFPYLGQINMQTGRLSGDIWLCPSHDSNMEARNEDLPSHVPVQEIQYSYFGQSNTWSGSATFPELLANKPFESGRIMMSDLIFRFVPNSAWFYSHSDDGPSNFDSATFGGGQMRTGKPLFSGANQLFADGSVTWRDKTQFDVDIMDSPVPDLAVRYVRGAGANGGNDLFFY